MRAQLAAMIGGGGLPAAAGVALVAAWIYAVERTEPVPGMAFLVVAVVALGWAGWMKTRRPPQNEMETE